MCKGRKLRITFIWSSTTAFIWNTNWQEIEYSTSGVVFRLSFFPFLMVFCRQVSAVKSTAHIEQSQLKKKIQNILSNQLLYFIPVTVGNESSSEFFLKCPETLSVCKCISNWFEKNGLVTYKIWLRYQKCWCNYHYRMKNIAFWTTLIDFSS